MKSSAAPAGSQTLERGLVLLTEIGRHADGRTTAQLCASTGLHRSIAHRLLVTLVDTGFALRDAEGRYRTGPATSALAASAGPTLREAAEPVLRELAVAVGATASLVEIVGDSAVTVLVAEPPLPGPRFSYRLGNHDPLDRGAGSIAALASNPPVVDEQTRIARTRAKGVVVTRGELHPGAIGVAAPLPGWDVAAAITVVTNRREIAAAAEPLVVAAAGRLRLLAPHA